MAPADKSRFSTAGNRPPISHQERQLQQIAHAQAQSLRQGTRSKFGRVLLRAAICATAFAAVLVYANSDSTSLSNVSSYITSIPFSTYQGLESAVSGIHWPWDPKRSEDCRPPSVNIFARSPPRPSNDDIIKSTAAIDKYLSDRASKNDIDSIAISVVTPAGTLWQGGYGLLRANDSELEGEKQVVDEDSIYRIASISKMFTVLETLILRERGALSWDDPVTRYIANFTLRPETYGWANHLDGVKTDLQYPRITLRDLASHLGGIGRDLPPSDIGDWPFVEEEPGDAKTQPAHDLQRRTNAQTRQWEETKLQDLLEAVSEYPLVNTPQLYPIYSNTGIDLLGLANVKANARFNPFFTEHEHVEYTQPETHKDLLQRDIFAPLRMTSSFFRLPSSPDLRDHIAVPSLPENALWADRSLGDANDPAGGQYSSLGDLSKLMKTLLDPMGRGGVVPASVVREWLRPVYVWGETSKQVGLPWEITALSGVTAYTKRGNLPGYHSEFAILPEYSLGIIILVTGSYADTSTLLTEVSKRLLPTISSLHNTELKRRYVGTWTNGDDVVDIGIDEGKGAVQLNKMVVRGVDVVELAYSLSAGGGRGGGQAAKAKAKANMKGKSIFLWPTGRLGEFRLAFGRPGLNEVKDIGCMPYWVSIDPPMQSRGAPLDLVYWKAGVLYYPSAGVSFARQ